MEPTGYPRRTVLVLDEWSIAVAEPPYLEDEISGGYAGATYVAATVIAMNEFGIDSRPRPFT